MPAATTHYLFSLDALKLLKDEDKKRITNLNMFYLGSQGPDIFFFHKAGITKDSLTRLGSKMHQIKVYDLISNFFTIAYNDNDLLSYIYGFLCHYALDSSAHPLVIYAANYLNNPKESENDNHCRYEAFIDTYVMKKKGLNKKDYDVYKAIKIDKVSKNKLAEMYKKALKTVFNIDVSKEELSKAIDDVVLFLRLLKPDMKLKMYIFRAIEKMFLHGKAKVTSLMLYNDNLDRADEILNLNHNEYFNVTDKSVKYNCSFDDCYHVALKKYQDLLNDPLNKELYKLNFEGNIYE